MPIQPLLFQETALIQNDEPPSFLISDKPNIDQAGSLFTAIVKNTDAPTHTFDEAVTFSPSVFIANTSVHPKSGVRIATERWLQEYTSALEVFKPNNGLSIGERVGKFMENTGAVGVLAHNPAFMLDQFAESVTIHHEPFTEALDELISWDGIRHPRRSVGEVVDRFKDLYKRLDNLPLPPAGRAMARAATYLQGIDLVADTLAVGGSVGQFGIIWAEYIAQENFGIVSGDGLTGGDVWEALVEAGEDVAGILASAKIAAKASPYIFHSMAPALVPIVTKGVAAATGGAITLAGGPVLTIAVGIVALMAVNGTVDFGITTASNYIQDHWINGDGPPEQLSRIKEDVENLHAQLSGKSGQITFDMFGHEVALEKSAVEKLLGDLQARLSGVDY